MQKIYAFIHPPSDQPLPNIERFLLSRKQAADFCFFSCKENATNHFYDHCIGYWYPEKEEDIKWAEENVWIMEDGEVVDNLSSADLEDEIIEEFAKRYCGGFEKHIFEIELDKI